MEIRNKTKWQIRIAALFIFVLGFAAGALTLNLLRPADASTPPNLRYRRFEQALDRLNLSPDQRTQIEKILTDFRTQIAAARKESQPKFRALRMDAHARIHAVLTAEQQQQLHELLKENS